MLSGGRGIEKGKGREISIEDSQVLREGGV